jgi:hypothetical protein
VVAARRLRLKKKHLNAREKEARVLGQPSVRSGFALRRVPKGKSKIQAKNLLPEGLCCYRVQDFIRDFLLGR